MAAFGHGVSSQLIPGGAQGEVLELRRHLFPFLGPLVEAERVQQAADLVRLHFLHGNGLTCQEGDTHSCTRAHAFGHMVKGLEAGMQCFRGRGHAGRSYFRRFCTVVFVVGYKNQDFFFF